MTGDACRWSVETGPAGTTVVRVAGELDFAFADKLGAELRAAFQESGSGLVVDLTDLVFLDSSGLRELLSLQRLSEADDRSFVLRNVGAQPRDVFEVSGTVDVFRMEESSDSG